MHLMIVVGSSTSPNIMSSSLPADGAPTISSAMSADKWPKYKSIFFTFWHARRVRETLARYSGPGMKFTFFSSRLSVTRLVNRCANVSLKPYGDGTPSSTSFSPGHIELIATALGSSILTSGAKIASSCGAQRHRLTRSAAVTCRLVWLHLLISGGIIRRVRRPAVQLMKSQTAGTSMVFISQQKSLRHPGPKTRPMARTRCRSEDGLLLPKC
mmetsp:Transcript_25425/g.79325  ORF Transcript_25425/g.79325 Transcript_25425/m.79325 type:complete len:213 (-) Transcript_25425:146-784(-)